MIRETSTWSKWMSAFSLMFLSVAGVSAMSPCTRPVPMVKMMGCRSIAPSTDVHGHDEAVEWHGPPLDVMPVIAQMDVGGVELGQVDRRRRQQAVSVGGRPRRIPPRGRGRGVRGGAPRLGADEAAEVGEVDVAGGEIHRDVGLGALRRLGNGALDVAVADDSPEVVEADALGRGDVIELPADAVGRRAGKWGCRSADRACPYSSPTARAGGWFRRRPAGLESSRSATRGCRHWRYAAPVGRAWSCL